MIVVYKVLSIIYLCAVTASACIQAYCDIKGLVTR